MESLFKISIVCMLVLTVSSTNFNVLRKQHAKQDSTNCDSTLSWIDPVLTIPNYPQYGATVYAYQFVSCSTYNTSIYFTKSWPVPYNEWMFVSSALVPVTLPQTTDSFLGVHWSENINMELSIDPLYFYKERYLWSGDGNTLIHDYQEDHIETSNQGGYIYSWNAFTVMYTSANSSYVHAIGSSFSRSYGTVPDTTAASLKYDNTDQMLQKYVIPQ